MNIVILLSGGVGKRLGSDIPKQYIPVGGKMIITHTLEGVLSNPLVDYVQIVADEVWRDTISDEICKNSDTSMTDKLSGFSSPGKNRQLSIYNAVLDLMEDKVRATESDVALIQDAVRPLTSQQTITDCLTKINGHDGALPVLPMKDTVYMSQDGEKISSLLNRDHLFAGQAPEAYRFGKYRKAMELLLPNEIMSINGAAEPAIMAGMDIAMFPGDERNFKLTTPADLEKYRGLYIESMGTERDQ